MENALLGSVRTRGWTPVYQPTLDGYSDNVSSQNCAGRRRTSWAMSVRLRTPPGSRDPHLTAAAAAAVAAAERSIPGATRLLRRTRLNTASRIARLSRSTPIGDAAERRDACLALWQVIARI